MKEAKQLGTYSENKCKHFSDNLLISNTFSLLIQDSSPFIWLPPTTAPIFLLGRVSVLSFTLKAIHLPQGEEFLGRDRCSFSENKPLSSNTMTHPRLYSSLHYWIFFFSGKEAIIQESMQKSLSKGCPSKFPSIMPPAPSCPSWDDDVSARLYARVQQGLRLASAAAL